MLITLAWNNQQYFFLHHFDIIILFVYIKFKIFIIELQYNEYNHVLTL